jgi:hypothetical protein
MNLILILLPVLLLIPILYLLFTRRAKGGSGADRSDAVERPELTGPEQHKRRMPP